MTHINESQLSDYVDGVLNQDDRADVERHLAECDACRDELEFLTTLREAIAQVAYSSLDQPSRRRPGATYRSSNSC